MCQLKWSAIIEKLTSFICELTFLFRSHVHVSTKSVARDFVLSIDVTCDHVWNKLQIKYRRQILNTDLTNKLNPHLFSLSGQFFWVSINTLVTVLKARDWLWELLTISCRPSFWREAAPSAVARITWPSIWWIKLSTESLTILATWILGSPD